MNVVSGEVAPSAAVHSEASSLGTHPCLLLIERWLMPRTEATAKVYRAALYAFKDHFDGPLSKARLADAVSWERSLVAGCYSKSTIQIRLNALRGFLRWAADCDTLFSEAAKAICVRGPRQRRKSRYTALAARPD